MIQRSILMAVFAILLALPAIPGSAQTPASTIPDDEDLTGLQAAVWRTYMPAGTFVGHGTIDLNDVTPASSPPDTVLPAPIIVVVREFDSAANAGVAFERISTGVEASMPAVFSDGTQEITSETLPDIGSQATLVRVEHVEPGVAVRTENAIVQRDQYVFLVTATASSSAMMDNDQPADTSLPTAEIAAAIAGGEPSPEEPALHEDGTSTGGLWGFMLPSGDPLLMGMIPIQDTVIYPTPDA